MVEDYKIQLIINNAEPTGKYETDKKGKIHPVLKYVTRYQTPAGVFYPEEWNAKALEAIEAYGQMKLLEKLKEYCRLHHAWLRKEAELENHAIDCLCSRAYRNWPEFGYDETIIWM